MVKLSAVLCVHNEERRLGRCLEALGFADEIVLVLDRCTDRTRAIGEAYGAVMISGVFPLEGPAPRGRAWRRRRGDWILEVDADEIVTPRAGARGAGQPGRRGASPSARSRSTTIVGERLIRHGWGGSFGTTMAARLYRRGTKRWGGERVHPKVIFDGPQGAEPERTACATSSARTSPTCSAGSTATPT